MKRKFFAFITLLTAGLSLSSCLDTNDDTNVEYSHDTAISAFSLGTMGRYVRRPSTGELDSLATSAVTGSDYKFTIDQAKREIYNEDSLPARTRTAAALATISAQNSSYIQLIYDRTEVKEGEDKDSIVWYNSSDSINFDKLNVDKAIRVYAQDFTVYADYKLKLNVHKEEADSFVWCSMAKNKSELAELQKVKAVALGNGSICVFGKLNDQTKAYVSTNGKDWSSINQDFIGADAYKNVAVLGGTLYLLSDNKLYSTVDAQSWTAQTPTVDAPLVQLIGASSTNLYAYTAAGISESKDNGATWTEEKVDVSNLPTNNISLNVCAIRSMSTAENVLLLGTRDTEKNDTVATRWLRTVDWYDGADVGGWNFVKYEENMPYKLPWSKFLTSSTTDGGFVALGTGDIRKGDTTSKGAVWYKSLDAGLTWKEDTLANISKIALDVDKPVGFVRDANNYYWVINNGNVWKGRFNKDGWLRKD